jgi:hypothetical protein
MCVCANAFRYVHILKEQARIEWRVQSERQAAGTRVC